MNRMMSVAGMFVFLFVFLTLATGPVSVEAARGADEPPAESVMALYFHRTQRCPTCRKMGDYAQEAVKTGFAEQLKRGQVVFRFVDFQDAKNAAVAKAYKVTGPALIVARVKDRKVVAVENLDQIWMKASDKQEFLDYVRDRVQAMREPSVATAPGRHAADP
jgi:thiol-disulfide isomerase/thioredoxin